MSCVGEGGEDVRHDARHVGTLPVSGMTSLQVALSFSGDFLEFVFDMAIECCFAWS